MAHDDARVPYDVAVERAVDVGLRRACYGALAGGASAFIFLRGPRARGDVATWRVVFIDAVAFARSRRARALGRRRARRRSLD